MIDVHPQGHHVIVDRDGCHRMNLTWTEARELYDKLTPLVGGLRPT